MHLHKAELCLLCIKPPLNWIAIHLECILESNLHSPFRLFISSLKESVYKILDNDRHFRLLWGIIMATTEQVIKREKGGVEPRVDCLIIVEVTLVYYSSKD